jgi:hypothetical protein
MGAMAVAMMGVVRSGRRRVTVVVMAGVSVMSLRRRRRSRGRGGMVRVMAVMVGLGLGGRNRREAERRHHPDQDRLPNRHRSLHTCPSGFRRNRPAGASTPPGRAPASPR